MDFRIIESTDVVCHPHTVPHTGPHTGPHTVPKSGTQPLTANVISSVRGVAVDTDPSAVLPGSVLPGWTEDSDAAVELSADGRVARRQRNRERVVDAYAALLRDGVVNPSATEVAERAELTPRSVYRYLREDLTLKADVAQRILTPLSSLTPRASLPSRDSLCALGPGDVQASTSDVGRPSLWDRVEAFISYHLDLFDRTAPIVKAVSVDHVADPFVAAAIDEVHAAMSEDLCRVFAPDLEQLPDEVQHADLIVLQSLLLFESLDYLYRHVGAEQTKAVLCRRMYAALTQSRTLAPAQ